MAKDGNVAIRGVVPVVVSVDGQLRQIRSALTEKGGSVPVMQIHIEHRSGSETVFHPELVHRDDQTVESTKSLPSRGMGVVKPAGQ
jgi:hypothetical protein